MPNAGGGLLSALAGALQGVGGNQSNTATMGQSPSVQSGFGYTGSGVGDYTTNAADARMSSGSRVL